MQLQERVTKNHIRPGENKPFVYCAVGLHESRAGPGNIFPHATKSFETTNILQGFLQKGESESFVVWSVEDTVLCSSWPQPEGASIQLNTVIAEYSARRNSLRSQSFLSFKLCLMAISICLTLPSPKTIAAKYAQYIL